MKINVESKRGFFKDLFRIVRHDDHSVSVFNDDTGDLIFTEEFPQGPGHPTAGHPPAVGFFITLTRGSDYPIFQDILVSRGYPAERI